MFGGLCKSKQKQSTYRRQYRCNIVKVCAELLRDILGEIIQKDMLFFLAMAPVEENVVLEEDEEEKKVV